MHFAVVGLRWNGWLFVELCVYVSCVEPHWLFFIITPTNVHILQWAITLVYSSKIEPEKKWHNKKEILKKRRTQCIRGSCSFRGCPFSIALKVIRFHNGKSTFFFFTMWFFVIFHWMSHGIGPNRPCDCTRVDDSRMHTHTHKDDVDKNATTHLIMNALIPVYWLEMSKISGFEPSIRQSSTYNDTTTSRRNLTRIHILEPQMHTEER